MKTLLISFAVFLWVVLSWGGAHFLWLQDEIVYRQMLLRKISDLSCLQNKVDQISKQQYFEKYTEVLEQLQWKLDRKIPETDQVAGVWTSVARAAKEAKIALVSFEVLSTTKTNNVFQKRLLIKTSGKFPGVFALLARLSGGGRIMKLESLVYSDDEAEMVMSVYYGDWTSVARAEMPRVYDCDNDLLDLGTAPTIPLEQPLSVIRLRRNPFIDTHVLKSEGLHLVGVVNEGDEWTAILEDAMGASKIVSVGDSAPGGFTVSSIQESHLILTKNGANTMLTWSE
ncbi:MAG: type 4a pilus biogenesis protein PilO [Myxococcota bacterium]